MLAEIKQAYCSLPSPARAQFLARLLYGSSVWARSQYPEIQSQPTASVAGLRAFNELVHVVSDQLRAILEDDPARYPDDVFFDILVEQACMTPGAAEVGGLLRELHPGDNSPVTVTG